MAKYIIEVPDTTQWIQWMNTSEKDGTAFFNYMDPKDLTPYTEPDREAIENEVWEFARKLTHPCNGGLYEYEKKEIFDRRNSDSVLIGMSYQEAKAKYDAWKKKEEDIHVGDEVETESGNKACVLYENQDGTQMFVFKADGTAAWWSKCAIHKTGKNHPEVVELLKKMREK